ncbi:MAG: N-acetyltransferase, partial [Firmicutes bacterium]|nr:N-acetyltransferase [Bacillota bacterium]
MLDIRKAKKDDLERIMEIYRYAQELMIESGNPTQWGRTFPDIELIRDDIESGISYVITDESGVQGVFALGEGDDPTYQLIEDGEWPSDASYLTVHRIASGGQVRGVFGFALQQIKSMANDIRIDTHENNKVMRRQIEKYGFKRCGTIFVRDGSPRI